MIDDFIEILQRALGELEMQADFIDESLVRIICPEHSFTCTYTSVLAEYRAGDKDAIERFVWACDLQLPNPMEHVSLEVPLLSRFLSLDYEIREKFPASDNEYNHGIDSVGLDFCGEHGHRNGDYFCTPLNTVVFAQTGQSGEHFSFLVENDSVTSDSPIVYTFPSGPPFNCIVAKDFEEFVRLGLVQGFFILNGLHFSAPRVLNELANTMNLPADRPQAVLKFVADALDLSPAAYGIEYFKQLQTHCDRLVLPDEIAARRYCLSNCTKVYEIESACAILREGSEMG